jgi:hypothetical protein
VRKLVNEAQRISNFPAAKSRKTLKTEKSDPTYYSQLDSKLTNDNTTVSIDDNEVDNANLIMEKNLLKSVESLITSIKSGQLIKEQELSNKRIQEILANVLDKESLRAFNFGEGVDIINEQENMKMNDEPSTTTTSDLLTLTENNLASHNNDETVVVVDSTKIGTDQNITEVTFDNLNATEREEERWTTRDCEEKLGECRVNEDYEHEVDLYLASLPAKVTTEDILNANATKLRLNERVKSSGLVSLKKRFFESEKKKKNVLSTEQRFARNMHLFCMLEHERRKVLLLPDELIDVTRKYHTRDKYEHVSYPI